MNTSEILFLIREKIEAIEKEKNELKQKPQSIEILTKLNSLTDTQLVLCKILLEIINKIEIKI